MHHGPSEETLMKRKGARDIPDFSSKRKPAPATGAPPRQATPNPVPRDRVVKPQATSAKFGRRGQ
jgi:hypothetical protein